MSILFKDRADAGRKLARLLCEEDLPDPVVLGVPRGGIPVAREVAMALDAPLSVFVARKLGAPHQPEFGIGAIAEGGGHVLDQSSVDALCIRDEEIEALLEREGERVRCYVETFRQGRPLPPVKGRTAILVDDGLATGVTVQAAVVAIRRLGPALTVVATPVASEHAVRVLRSCADRVLAVAVPTDFWAVGQFYADFEQLPDGRLVEMLRELLSR